VAQMADDVAVMYLGSVVEKGPVGEIFAAPKHPYTQALLESIPSRHATARVRLPAISGSIPHPFNRPAGCSFHPRCRQALAGLCAEETPPALQIVNTHEVSCHLYDSNGAERPPALTVRDASPNGSSAQVAATERPAVSTQKLLEVRDLYKQFASQGRRLGRARGIVRAVDGVSFDLHLGETLALVGESGSGKTTASRCVMRALSPESGTILFQTKSGDVVDLAKLSTKQLRPLRPEIQMIFQDPYSSLNPRMTILDIVGEPLLVNGVKSRQERADRVEELLTLVGLRPEYMRRYPHAFSGGQRQRIGVARALALNPRLVVADEPVSALDVSVQAQTLNLLMNLQDRLGLTYLFVSHDLSVVKHISDRIGVMYGGQLVELGDSKSVLSEPRHPYTATLLAAIPNPDPAVRTRFDIPRAKPLKPSETMTGCQFQRRCIFAEDRCRLEKPAWEEVGVGRHVRCHRANEIVLPIGSVRT
jgi:peptide/nickel transport system ATP-binding protein